MAQGFIKTELDQIKEAGLYRRLRRVENDQGPTLMLDGREVINFSSNNYLGIANHPALAAAAKMAIDRYGCGSGASRLISGNMTLHEELEAKLAAFKGTEAALVFNSGFQVNTGILSTLTGEGDAIFSDALNHASIIDGCRLSRAKTFVYSHGDLDQLEAALKQADGAGRKLIVTETIFSMDGDEAPLSGIVDLAEKYGAMVMVDEAHATGIFGDNGAGVVAKLGLSERVAVQMGTLGKALGGFGAYVACSATLRDYLINRCSGLIYSTALPPPVLGAIDAALDLVPSLDAERAHVASLAERFRQGARILGYDTGTSTTQIVPLIAGSNHAALSLSKRLRDAGFFATAIRPPTVPAGTARLRLAFTAAHSNADIDGLLEALDDRALPRSATA